MTQYTEDGFEQQKVTASMLLKHRTVEEIIRNFIKNRKFCVKLNGIKSSMRQQKKSYPKKPVFTPLLLNMDANEQLIPTFVCRFIYADNLCLIIQTLIFQEIDTRLKTSTFLEQMGQYYVRWSIHSNLIKI